MITAVYFDGDQTLWDFDAVMRRALTATVAELRRHREVPERARVDIESLIADRDAAAAEMDEQAPGLERVRLAGFQQTLARLGVPDDGLAQHLTDFYLERRFRDVELFPDTLPALTALRGSYAVGLLTNGNSYPDRCGLGGTFDAVVVAQDHGIAKPDPRLFEVAASELGREPAQLAMVGDSPANDVAGAIAAGWRGIWLDRGGGTYSASVSPDARITTLTELPSVLEQLTPARNQRV